MSRFVKLAMVFIFCFFSACATVGYHSYLREWTRGRNIYEADTFGARIMWKVTYLSPEFKNTAMAKVSEWMKLPPGEMGPQPSYLSDMEEGEFLVSIYMPREYPLITSEVDNFWQFTLSLPTGESLLHTKIESVPVTPRETRLFPYINRWGKLYLVKFPAAHLEKPFSVTLRSAAVTSTLDWK